MIRICFTSGKRSTPSARQTKPPRPLGPSLPILRREPKSVATDAVDNHPPVPRAIFQLKDQETMIGFRVGEFLQFRIPYLLVALRAGQHLHFVRLSAGKLRLTANVTLRCLDESMRGRGETRSVAAMNREGAMLARLEHAMDGQVYGRPNCQIRCERALKRGPEGSIRSCSRRSVWHRPLASSQLARQR